VRGKARRGGGGVLAQARELGRSPFIGAWPEVGLERKPRTVDDGCAWPALVVVVC
jgi:hypothetical protein